MLLSAAFLLISQVISGQPGVYKTYSGIIQFKSNAPLEQIEAKSVALRGVLDVSARNFAFSVPVASFKGFNSALQREHFNENYLKSDEFTEATFSGRIIEDINFQEPGEYTIRAKGKLSIHGVQTERIIKCVMLVGKDEIQVVSDFTILLVDHGIQIPRVVHQKIAEEIKVNVAINLKK